MNAGRLRFFPPTGAKKERDEELALFRELFKREREKNMSLLESVSTDLEPLEGNSVVFKIASGKKTDSHGNENDKNDYDWLKTPPATPLFQSLEMDAGQGMIPNMIIHKELPIIPVLKPSRFVEKKVSKAGSKPPCSPSVASFRSGSSSRPETPDSYPLSPPRSITTPITTPRFQRFAKDFNTDPSSIKPLQSTTFVRRNNESVPKPRSPGAISVTSSAASSRPVSPNVNPKPPSIRKAASMVREQEGPKTVPSSIKRISKQGPIKQKLDPKIQSLQAKSDGIKRRSSSPSSKSITSSTSSRPHSPDSEQIKIKTAPKALEKTVKKTMKEAATKQKPESKPDIQTDAPLVRSRFPTFHSDFPTEAPPNLITSVPPGRPTSASRSRSSVPAIGNGDEKGIDKRGGKSSTGVVIGSSMVDKMLNARKSTVSGKLKTKDDKGSKLRAKETH